MKVRMTCPICGKENTLEVETKIFLKYQKYREGYGLIQDIPLPADQREFLKTGMCMKCQEWIFAEPEEDEEVMI